MRNITSAVDYSTSVIIYLVSWSQDLLNSHFIISLTLFYQKIYARQCNNRVKILLWVRHDRREARHWRGERRVSEFALEPETVLMRGLMVWNGSVVMMNTTSISVNFWNRLLHLAINSIRDSGLVQNPNFFTLLNWKAVLTISFSYNFFIECW